MLDPQIQSLVDNLWQKFWDNQMSDGLVIVTQISYLIFMRQIEITDENNKKRANDLKQEFQSIFVDHDDCKWSYWKNKEGDEIVSHVKDIVFPFIQKLHGDEDTLFSKHMKDATFQITRPSLLQQAVSLIDEIFSKSNKSDVQGDIYEEILAPLGQAGTNGQFRTPRHIIRMIVKLINPQIGETICDPASGTSGFLIGAFERILELNTVKKDLKYENDDEDLTPHNLIGNKLPPEDYETLTHDMLYGFEASPSIFPIGLMNMILHGIKYPNLEEVDSSLSSKFSWDKKYEIIMSNPPFSGNLEREDINKKFRLTTTKTELLFGELFYNLLDEGCRAGIVVPTGLLSGQTNAHKKFRTTLLNDCSLDAVIYMPPGIFLKYSGIETAVLIFTKGGTTDKVWFYVMESDGYTLNQKRRFIDGKGDIPDIIKKFETKDISEKSLIVNKKDIEDNDLILLPQQYIEITHEKKQFKDPSKILDEIRNDEDKLLSKMNEIEEILP